MFPTERECYEHEVDDYLSEIRSLIEESKEK